MYTYAKIYKTLCSPTIPLIVRTTSPVGPMGTLKWLKTTVTFQTWFPSKFPRSRRWWKRTTGSGCRLQSRWPNSRRPSSNHTALSRPPTHHSLQVLNQLLKYFLSKFFFRQKCMTRCVLIPHRRCLSMPYHDRGESQRTRTETKGVPSRICLRIHGPQGPSKWHTFQ